MFFYYNDGDSSQWVSAIGAAGGVAGATGPAGSNGATGATGPAGGASFAVTNAGSASYIINGGTNPTINLIRGFIYYFNLSASGHPFWIKTAQVTGTGSAYSSGVTNNGVDTGTITFGVPFDAPNTLYYICQYHGSMVGVLNISDLGPAGATGPAGSTVSRSAVSAVTASLANAASGNVDVTGFKSYALYKIQTSAACWVRIYTDTASRAADSARTETTDPGASSGVVAEVIATGANTIVIAPAAIGFNNESTPTTTIPCAVTNKSGSTQAITVTLTLLQLEL